MFYSEDDPYSFSQSYEFSTERRSKPHNVKYYVNPRTFPRKYATERKQKEIDAQVESDVI